MNTIRFTGIMVITCSFIIALILNILPLPTWAVWFRPDWVAIVLIYWVIALPHRINIGVAFVIGMVVDVLSGTLLGEHSLAMVVMAYFAAKVYRQIRVFPLWQQAVCVLMLIVIYQALLFWVQAIIGQVADNRFWLSAITSMVIWPWLFIILRDSRRRFKIY